jgi:hypothetical protein
MCSRFLSHNELLSKRDESPWNRLLLKLIFESLTIVRVAERQEIRVPAHYDDKGRLVPSKKIGAPRLDLEQVDEEDRLIEKVSGVKLTNEYIDSVSCSL